MSSGKPTAKSLCIIIRICHSPVAAVGSHNTAHATRSFDVTYCSFGPKKLVLLNKYETYTGLRSCTSLHLCAILHNIYNGNRFHVACPTIFERLLVPSAFQHTSKLYTIIRSLRPPYPAPPEALRRAIIMWILMRDVGDIYFNDELSARGQVTL